ncbi:hypothetical protein [Dyella sp.]|uniref:hypothetical protein n=1 Tax=Dyella sp. TaxID=1869338 RepID=UPI002D78E835|nr:hypothetical protein [Dyella sp.]HET7331423.1 hypothetical protein [Dyella sp.]
MKLSAYFCTPLGLAAGMIFISAAHASVVDEGQGAGTQSTAVGVNDAGIVIGDGLSATNKAIAFFDAGMGNERVLPALADGACSASAITNTGKTSQILGSCDDAHGVGQAVRWNSNDWSISEPAVALAQLGALGGLLGIGADVRTVATAQNDLGEVVGESFSSNGTGRPVFWAAGSTTPTELGAGLLGLASTNCIPTSINTPANPGARAVIVGSCPNDGSNTGKPVPILWTSPTTSVVLSVPADAQYCSADEINGEGDVLGSCLYANDVNKTVRWAYPWTSTPIVLESISGIANSHNSGVDINASGQVACNYSDGNGFNRACEWDPSTGTDAVDITPLTDGSTAEAVAIGNNGEIVGISETRDGHANGFHSLQGASPVDDAPLPGGSNDGFVAESPSGAYAVGRSEVAGHGSHAVEASLP